jgi:hypothetical protein
MLAQVRTCGLTFAPSDIPLLYWTQYMRVVNSFVCLHTHVQVGGGGRRRGGGLLLREVPMDIKNASYGTQVTRRRSIAGLPGLVAARIQITPITSLL